MLRKLALAVGAVAFCGAVQAQASISQFPHSDDGESYKGDDKHKEKDDHKGGDSYKGDKCESIKIIVPKFENNCDLTEWLKSLDCKENRGNVFVELVKGCSPKDLGFCLPKCELKTLEDLRSDIKDVLKDFDKADKDKHDEKKGHDEDKYADKDGHKDYDKKGLREDIKCDLTDIRKDICEFAEGLKEGCHHDRDCDHHEQACAVPAPAAASQGLIGMGVLGCLSLIGAARRRAFGRAS
jgi:hypothetical protein